ncbi:HU family DNA-binding protein [Vibrio cholerae]|uniref:HU family DNA-binding protein n=1 Tax=Vibrio cholerae TaxID=666 RepID=UPI001C92D8A5|nr:HU family DNA-binding protein [Vibrio cholerae]MBY4643328.1 HU family DNA-binding protein [Vibrio cholerae]MCR9658535.1 HU family DNA-binding protein [Vibrio cholerae]MCR9689216.1 HU family DNA-binding protein [Vibrio cholerae]MCR9738382.1 HU family DNA-binding protein [Vibrio cholerae]MCR9746548.1 HU family DNA-binding protein [Vibrio cholerae]
MNKSELIMKVAEDADISKAKAEAAVNALINSVAEELKAGGIVTLTGFGTFHVKKRAARTGRNPRTGENIQIAAANIPGFKAGKGLKDSVS